MFEKLVQPEPSVAVTVYVPADNAVVSALFKSKVTNQNHHSH